MHAGKARDASSKRTLANAAAEVASNLALLGDKRRRWVEMFRSVSNELSLASDAAARILELIAALAYRHDIRRARDVNLLQRSIAFVRLIRDNREVTLSLRPYRHPFFHF